LLKQFSAKEGGGVEKNVKRDELLLAKQDAFKAYMDAEGKSQKDAAEAKIADINAKIKALDTPAAQPVDPKAPASKTTKDDKRNELLLAKDVAFKDYTIATSKEQKAAAEAKIADINAKIKALDTPAAQPVNPAAPASKTAAPTVAADQAKKELEKQQQDKTAAEKKKVEEEAAKKKQEEDAAKKKQEENKNKKPESAETLLAELNTKMATLLKYTYTVAHNTNETVSATRGLNNNLLKS